MQKLHTAEVTEDQIDHLGHMNVRFYAEHAHSGSLRIAESIGLATSAGQAVMQRDRYTRHHREQMLGAQLEVRGGVMDADAERVRLYEELANSDTGDIAATFVLTLQPADADGGDPLPIEQGVLDAAAGWSVAVPEHGQPRSLSIDDDPVAMAPGLDVLRERDCALREVRVIHPEECDPRGRLRSGLVAELVWGGTPVKGRDFRPFSEGPGGMKIGWATMETRGSWHHLPALGERVQSYGVETNIAEKTMTSNHWVHDVGSGELVCAFSVVNIAFDVAARRAVVIPDDVRAEMSHNLHADLDGLTSD